MADTNAVPAFGAGGVVAAHTEARLRERLFGETAPPIRLGRYVLGERIAHGGMGIVFAAHDTALDRRVALKLLREHDPRRPLQISAEAQAIAKLSHPNVIHVYDLGVCDGEVFMATELVEGPSLAEWVGETPRSIAEIVAAYVAAGRGLAAAHAHGIVHCDFKPSNVVHGRDGIVRVLDFGLAHVVDPASAAIVDARAGVRGTPLYMAPEQHACAEPDARADQYAFCVALSEALHGVPPFTGDTVARLAEAKRTCPPAAPRRLPSRIARVLRRGLHPDPAARFSDMDALLRAVAAAPRARWPWVAAAIAVLAGSAIHHWYGARQLAACLADELPGIWSPARAAALTERIAAAEPDASGAIAGYIVRQLDARAEAIRAGRRDSCNAGPSSQASARTECLDRLVRDLDELVGVLEELDPSVVVRAPNAIANATDVSACTRERAEMPTGFAEGSHAALMRAQALLWFGSYVDARRLAELARLEASASGDAQAERRARLLLAKAMRQLDHPRATRDLAHEVLIDAERNHDVPTAVEALVVASDASLLLPDDRERALADVELALAKADELGAAVRAPALGQLGDVYVALGRFAEAAAVFASQRELVRAELGGEHPSVAAALDSEGAALARAGQAEAAMAAFDEALAIRERVFGPMHPLVANTCNNLAAVFRRAGRPADAWGHLQRAIAIDRAWAEPPTAAFATKLCNAGVLLDELGQPAEAAAYLREGIAMFAGITARDDDAVAICRRRLAALDPDVSAG